MLQVAMTSVMAALVLTRVAADCEMSVTCYTSLTQADCAPGEYLLPNQTVHQCCPGCVARAGLAEHCDPGIPCAPGLHCEQNTCVLNFENCHHVQHTNVTTQPSCLPDGSWAPAQCKGDVHSGRCFCTDPDGRRIFGMMWRSQLENDNMSCACSRKRVSLEGSGRYDATLHCSADGAYEALQCDAGVGACWCVEPHTGEHTSAVVTERDVNLLPCYDSATVGHQYLRQCESAVVASARIAAEQAARGTVFIATTELNCDYDGTYGNSQVENGIAYCSAPDGARLGSWAAMVGTAALGMNCNCARDTMLHFPAVGITMSMECLGNGNYNPHQTAAGQYYCVDGDGYPLTGLSTTYTEEYCQNLVNSLPS